MSFFTKFCAFVLLLLTINCGYAQMSYEDEVRLSRYVLKNASETSIEERANDRCMRLARLSNRAIAYYQRLYTGKISENDVDERRDYAFKELLFPFNQIDYFSPFNTSNAQSVDEWAKKFVFAGGYHGEIIITWGRESAEINDFTNALYKDCSGKNGSVYKYYMNIRNDPKDQKIDYSKQ